MHVEHGPLPRHRSGRGHDVHQHSACVSLKQSPKFLAGLAYASYMITACTEELKLKFPHMVLVYSFSSGLGSRFCRLSRNCLSGGMCWCFFQGITGSFLSCFSLEKPLLSAGPRQDLWAV